MTLLSSEDLVCWKSNRKHDPTTVFVLKRNIALWAMELLSGSLSSTAENQCPSSDYCGDSLSNCSICTINEDQFDNCFQFCKSLFQGMSLEMTLRMSFGAGGKYDETNCCALL